MRSGAVTAECGGPQWVDSQTDVLALNCSKRLLIAV